MSKNSIQHNNKVGFGGQTTIGATGRTPLLIELLRTHQWVAASKEKREILGNSKILDPGRRITILKKCIISGNESLIKERYEEAAEHYVTGLAIDSKNLDCLRNLAILDVCEGRADNASILIQSCLSIQSDIASLWSVEFQCSLALGHKQRREYSIAHAKRLGMDYESLCLAALGNCKHQYRNAILGEIQAYYLGGAQPSPGFIAATFMELKQEAFFGLEDAVDIFLALDDVHVSLLGMLFLYLQPLAEDIESNKALCGLMKKYGSFIQSSFNSDSTTIPPYVRSERSLEKQKIRIGFVGGDFRRHVVGRFLLPLVENINKDRFELFFFNTNPINEPDDFTQRFGQAGLLINVEPGQLHSTVEVIRSYRLDYCCDVAGFTAHGIPHAYAARLGQYQIAMYGFPGSTFMPGMDLLLTSDSLKPTYDWMHSESLLTIKGISAVLMDPGEKDAPVNLEVPQLRNRFINFGVLINPYKYNKRTISLWAKVLKATPNSQLAIVRPECSSLCFQENIIKELELNGVASSRVLIVNNHGRGLLHYTCYNNIDVSLDTIPMSGGTSTVESLIMGVPLIAMRGINFHSRVSSSILEELGLGQFIADSDTQYIQIASEIAQNVSLLRGFRKTAYALRSMQGGPCDGKNYALSFESALAQHFQAAS